jgi:hypothetical protein
MPQLSNVALTVLAPVILRRARFAWIGYGVGAYVALRLARHYGILGEFPDRALTALEDGYSSIMGEQPRRRSDSVAANASI